MGKRLTDKERWDRQITEAQVQATITDALDLYGWLWHHETDSRKSKAGFPDICAVHPRTGALLFLELKKELGVVSPEQQTWIDALGRHVGAEWERCRCEALVVRPSNMDLALALIKRWGQ